MFTFAAATRTIFSRMKKCILLIFVCLYALGTQGQQEVDSTRVLGEVTVTGYRYDRSISEVPLALAVLDQRSLNRFSNTSFLPAVNTVAGVRMEERSPGSYRFSIRGSLLRSPFGVRNVKMYWNGLPLTDAGGNTYLNLIDFQAVKSLEIIKGPGASLYGAGTGGVVLLNNSIEATSNVQLSSLWGSYGLQRYQAGVQAGTTNLKAKIQYAHQQADGYRDHTSMRRDALNAEVVQALNTRSALTSTIFYTDLFYETPGGLTKTQYEENPRQARLNAEALNASVSNKTFYVGLTHDYQWNEHWSTRTGLYGSQSDFKNPTFFNYEKRKESNLGGRMENQFVFNTAHINGKILFGAEYQHFFSPIQVSNNDQGSMGTQVLSDDELTANQLLGFVQGEIELPKKLFITVGGSVNFLKYGFVRYAPSPANQQRKFDPVFSPRLALLKRIKPSLSIYASVSQGFSPPSLAEVRPSTNAYNDELKPEHGTSYEAGIKGSTLREKITFDVALYNFGLKETIVIQRTPEGQDYFINAGETSQRGLEATARWIPLSNAAGLISSFALWSSYTYNHYRFEDYVNDGADYSGNKLTGVAPTIVVAGMDLTIRSAFYWNITANYTDHIPLNDANSVYAAEYFLLGSRLGYVTHSKKLPIEFFIGIDNALDKKYSLGNDLNARGGRFFNAAADRNYYGGIKANLVFKKE